MADNNWLALGTIENPNPASTRAAGKAPKTSYDKMLTALDEQYALWRSGKKPESPRHAGRRWFKDVGNGVTEVTVRFANRAVPLFPNKATSFFVPDKKNVKAVYQGLKADLEAHAFDDVIKPIEAEQAKTVAQRKATRASK